MNSDMILNKLDKLLNGEEIDSDYELPPSYDKDDLYKYYSMIEIYKHINQKIKDEKKRLYAFYLTDLFAEDEEMERETVEDIVTDNGKYKCIDIEKGPFDSVTLLKTEKGNSSLSNESGYIHVEGLMCYTNFTYEDVYRIIYQNDTDLLIRNRKMVHNHWVDINECPIFTKESLYIYENTKFKNKEIKRYVEIMLKTIDICRLEIH